MPSVDPKLPLGKDPHSYANFDQVKVTHIRLDWVLDFDSKCIGGSATLTLERLDESCQEVFLDNRGLAIERVVNADDGSPLLWTLPRHHPVLGMALCVPVVAETKTFIKRIRVDYRTTRDSAGISWFDPHQTLGGKHPFVYTQFEAILARTCIPLQDTPAVKSTLEMVVSAPVPLVPACTGIFQEGSGQEVQIINGRQHRTFCFQQKIPIPSYLIAVAAGNIHRYQLGARTYVWCEPELSEKAKFEFVQAEDFVSAAERLVNVPYLWGTYEMLLLPVTFPYGGMENPNLTFLNSVLVVGDRSLVNVIAHEIAHSWTGNLVTNGSWSDFWLNEGFTVYFERMILGEVYGHEYKTYHGHLGYESLLTTQDLLLDEPEFRKLRPNMNGMDPDEAFSKIPYEKGCCLMYYLESLVGGQQKMQEWLHNYLQTFKERSITSEQMIDHFDKFFPHVKVDWNSMLYNPELISFDPRTYLKNKPAEKIAKLAKDIWINKSGEGASPSDVDPSSWNTTYTMGFLDQLLLFADPALQLDVLAKMNHLYGFGNSHNTEIQYRWLLLKLKAGDTSAGHLKHIDDFLSTHGRGLYLRPLYKQLTTMEKKGLFPVSHVHSLYFKNKTRYHPCLYTALERVIGHLRK